jgi:hypothetical protein
LSASDRDAIRELAADLPAVWQAETTTPADRQRIARLLLERVEVTVDKQREQVEVRLHWAGGSVGTLSTTVQGDRGLVHAAVGCPREGVVCR